MHEAEKEPNQEDQRVDKGNRLLVPNGLRSFVAKLRRGIERFLADEGGEGGEKGNYINWPNGLW